jgi:Zn-dependent oligopeptidase
LDFPSSARQVAKECGDAISRARSGLETVITISDTNRDFTNTPEAIENALAESREKTDSLSFLRFVSTSTAVREAARACGDMARRFEAETYGRPDLLAAAREYSTLKEPLAGEPKRLVESQLRDFKRNGADLPGKERKRLALVQQAIADHEASFLRNIAAADAAERIKDNFRVLDRLLELRAEAAEHLGHRSHAHFETEGLMLGNPLAVEWFLDRLTSGLKEPALRQLKLQEDLNAAKGPDGTWFEPSAWQGAPQGPLQELPSRTLLDGMLALANRLYGARFREISPGKARWYPDARLYEFSLAPDILPESGATLGFLYADLYERPGKTLETAAFSLARPRQSADASRRPAVAALVANLPRAQPGTQTLLPMEQAGALLRAFGKALHLVLSLNRYARFSAAQTPWDFAEVPGLVFERWAWSPVGLPLIHGSPNQGPPGQPDLSLRLAEFRAATSGIPLLREAALAELDRRLHTAKVADPCAEHGRLLKKTGLVGAGPGTCGPADFGFLVEEGGRRFKGLWARAVAEDLFARFGPLDLPDPVLARQFREIVLDPGATADPAALVQAFLGRPATERPFLESVGAKPGKNVQ